MPSGVTTSTIYPTMVVAIIAPKASQPLVSFDAI